MWLINTLRTCIGKKVMMAVTGFCFCGFLAAHLAGNLTLYKGKDAFNAYAEKLHGFGPLLTAAEWGLLLLAIIHVLTGATLFYENLKARPTSYSMKKRAGGRTIGSATMPYTGFILLIFIVFHLFNFHFVDKTHQTIFDIVSGSFARPGYVVAYALAMIVAAVHVRHGFWSAFQTIGANHPKYIPLIQTAGLVFSVMVGIGFGLLPVYISLMS